MFIRKIETFPIRIPFKSSAGAAASAWGDKGQPVADSLLVRVTTDDGLEGWGEAFGFRAVSTAKLAIDELIAPICLGRDAGQITSLMLEVQRKLHVFGRGGSLLFGLSAIDIALWDIAGKAAGMPVHRLLGGSDVVDLPCYASLIRYSEPSSVRANVRRAIDSGFKCLKLHEIELPSVRAARDEAGADVELTLDVNCPWTLMEARVKAEELKNVGLKWLEEPIWPPEDYSALAELRKNCEVPIAAGENASTITEFARLLSERAVDFVQPSVAKMGGITEICKVFPLAAVNNATVMPHCFYDGPGLLAAIHVTAALGAHEAMVEWRYFDLEAQLYNGSFVTQNGRIAVPQSPGFGIDPDPNVIRDYLRDDVGSCSKKRA